MKIVGIVAEYNPFHNGHLYQIIETKNQTNCDALIAVMSGNFSQRGEATLVDKFTRTKMALLNGIDLVIELPVSLATASAERFANGAISIFNQSQIVSLLSFGSECGTLTDLNLIAQTLVQNEATLYSAIQRKVKDGISFPKARQYCLKQLLKHTSTHLDSLLQSPNNILGIEYLKALLKSHSSIIPLTIKRIGATYHHETLDTPVASATAIRIALYANQDCQKHMPLSAFNLLKQTSFPSMEKLSAFLHYLFLFSKPETFDTIWDIPNGLLHTFINLSQTYPDYQTLVQQATSKTYTRSTVQRSLLRLLLKIQREDMAKLNVPYIRVLGCNKSKTWLLKKLSQEAKVPMITNLSRQYHTLNPIQKIWIDYELRASKLYAYLTSNPKMAYQDLTEPFILL